MINLTKNMPFTINDGCGGKMTLNKKVKEVRSSTLDTPGCQIMNLIYDHEYIGVIDPDDGTKYLAFFSEDTVNNKKHMIFLTEYMQSVFYTDEVYGNANNKYFVFNSVENAYKWLLKRGGEMSQTKMNDMEIVRDYLYANYNWVERDVIVRKLIDDPGYAAKLGEKIINEYKEHEIYSHNKSKKTTGESIMVDSLIGKTLVSFGDNKFFPQKIKSVDVITDFDYTALEIKLETGQVLEGSLFDTIELLDKKEEV